MPNAGHYVNVVATEEEDGTLITSVSHSPSLTPLEALGMVTLAMQRFVEQVFDNRSVKAAIYSKDGQ